MWCAALSVVEAAVTVGVKGVGNVIQNALCGPPDYRNGPPWHPDEEYDEAKHGAFLDELTADPIKRPLVEPQWNVLKWWVGFVNLLEVGDNAVIQWVGDPAALRLWLAAGVAKLTQPISNVNKLRRPYRLYRPLGCWNRVLQTVTFDRRHEGAEPDPRKHYTTKELIELIDRSRAGDPALNIKEEAA